MVFFELEPKDISELNDADLRELVARLCEAELAKYDISPYFVSWGGAQEAPDGGLDVSVVDSGKNIDAGFIPRANTGFQVKKHSMGKASCKKEMLDKNKSLKPVIASFADKKGAYIIVSGKDDCSDKMLNDRLQGMQEAIQDLANGENLHFDFYGRDRLASWLRTYPSVSLWVRDRLGKTLSGWRTFTSWTQIPKNYRDEYLIDNELCFIDKSKRSVTPVSRVDGINLIRGKLRKDGSVVRLNGLSGVGKTRFAQALFEEKVGEGALSRSNVIYADIGEEVEPTASQLVSYLSGKNYSAYVVLDNCPPNVHRSLQKQVDQQKAKLSLLTIEYDISDDQPEHTDVFYLEPSGEETVTELIQLRFPRLGWANANKITMFSGGNPRLAIALSNRVVSDETLSSFTDDDLFQRLFSQKKPMDIGLLESAEILSLVYSFNISRDKYNNELSTLEDISGIERRKLYRNHKELLRRQVSQQRGEWRAILPHALANRLAKRAFENISPEDINDEILKKENIRLFKSCARRVAYLHDCEAACHLASTWVQSGAVLGDLLNCEDDQLKLYEYLVSVVPDEVLRLIEKASLDDARFSSKVKNHFSFFVHLLRVLIYQKGFFERSIVILLKLARYDHAGLSGFNQAERQLTDIFSLRFSGTEASPKQRQKFLRSLIKPSKPEDQKIADKLLKAALKTSNWSSHYYGGVDHGAHARNEGWEPTTAEDKLDWYEGFIAILKLLLQSDDVLTRNHARNLLSEHFHGLWVLAGCFDYLEELITEEIYKSDWVEMWISIKCVLNNNQTDLTSESYKKLVSLEKRTAPSDICSKIEAYAFISAWEYRKMEGAPADVEKEDVLFDAYGEMIISLGKRAATEKQCLENLSHKIWRNKSGSLYFLGVGLAKGSDDIQSTFTFLLDLLNQYNNEINPVLLKGFISTVYEIDTILAQSLLNQAYEKAELRASFVELLMVLPMSSFVIEQLQRAANSGDIEAKNFSGIASCCSTAIDDNGLIKLAKKLNELDSGCFVVLDILGRRLHPYREKGYIPDKRLYSIGRLAIVKSISIPQQKIDKQKINQFSWHLDRYFSENAPLEEIHEIIQALYDSANSDNYNNNDLQKNYIDHLIQRFPNKLLDYVFERQDKEITFKRLFNNLSSVNESSLNKISTDHLINWCGKDQEKIKIAANTISYLPPYDTFGSSQEERVLSQHTFVLLDLADDKTKIVKIIFKHVLPNVWSGSRAEVAENRLSIMEALLEHPSKEVRESVASNIIEIQKIIGEEKKWETERNREKEQRFE